MDLPHRTRCRDGNGEAITDYYFNKKKSSVGKNKFKNIAGERDETPRLGCVLYAIPPPERLFGGSRENSQKT